MDYSKTYFPFLHEDCLREFGQAAGAELYRQSCERLGSMLQGADYRNNKGIKDHILKNMYPMIAYYLTLQDHGYSKEEASGLTRNETQKAAHIQKAKNEAIAKLPFGYRVFKLCIKGVMRRSYPSEGWETEWVKFDREEIHLNFTRCIYQELTTQHGCPELCTVFCMNDPVTFAGYAPKILFERNGTLAEGASCCAFHFIRGKKQ